MAAQQQPPWQVPQPQTPEPVLKVYNSLTKSKTEFVPRNGRHVKWYNCGPTVYDASHMGHARNYVTQDILRRIMQDYFGYDVHFVMNITDIEDKIILRARQNYLVENFISQYPALTPALLDVLLDAWSSYAGAKLPKGLGPAEANTDVSFDGWLALYERVRSQPVLKAEALKRDEKFDMHMSALNRAHLAIVESRQALEKGETGPEAAQRVINEVKDPLAVLLDDQFKTAPTPLPPTIFRKLSTYWEEAFFADMDKLHVLRPSTLTRVTEYVPEIVTFVEKIIANGYAYESEGSVYFDTAAFDGKNGHVYARLEPGSKGNRELLEEGEGALSGARGRRQSSDFALWKASKVGEPAWPSPWGEGRPGWHIECSVMASAVLGAELDVHSGGSDLAFPHHDNELAQSEAFHECPAWVNYFLHSGHLHIEGLKMSKSLKNFITIDEILQRFTPRQLRLAFLTQSWNGKIDFSESLMAGEVKAVETSFNNFFTTVKAYISQAKTEGLKMADVHGYDAAEQELTTALHDAQVVFRAALCDSFNTPLAMDTLRELVSRANVYVTQRGRAGVNLDLVERIARWVSAMLRMFGLGEGQADEVGWGEVRADGEGANREEVLMPYLRVLSTFRDDVRKAAMSKDPAALKDILALCDRLRDSDLVPLGVALDDQDDGRALVKLVSPAELVRARDEKRAAAEAKAAEKAARLAAAAAKTAARMEKGRAAPAEMFKPPHVPEGTYSAWDAAGLPTQDGEGKDLSKSAGKKVAKEFAAQQKLHDEYLKWKAEGN